MTPSLFLGINSVFPLPAHGRHVWPVSQADILLVRPVYAVRFNLLEPVGEPPRNPARGEYRGKEFRLYAYGREDYSRVKIHVRMNLLFGELFQHDFFNLLGRLDQRRANKAFPAQKRPRVTLQNRGARVLCLVYPVPDPGYLFLFFELAFDISPHVLLAPYLMKHLYHLFVRPAVTRPGEGSYGGRNYPIRGGRGRSPAPPR